MHVREIVERASSVLYPPVVDRIPRHRALAWVPVALGVAIGLASCGTDEDPHIDQHELSGFVRDDLEGTAIRGATVTFTSDTLRRESTTTDSDGHYEMVVETDVDFGQVRAEAAGYDPAEESVFFDTDSRTVDIRMRPAAAPEM